MHEEDKPEIRAPADSPLELNEASFAWPGTSNLVLRGITAKFPPGLTVITGNVGAGKTALLQAVLGEIDLRGGGLTCPEGSIAYCAQIAWLESKSIRDNILFALPYDEERYRQVVEACALVVDFSTFKSGDLTEIGENGVGLSGGQRARVALARAVYSRAQTVLLDDPLSALDRTTSSHIVEKCFGGPLLRDRTVLLVTHHAELMLGLVSQTIHIVNGCANVLDHAFSPPSSEDSLSDEAPKKSEELQVDLAAPEKFIEEEFRAHGGVKTSVYWQYVRAGRLYWWAILICFMIIYRVVGVFQTYFLKEWAERYGSRVEIRQILGPLRFFDSFPPPDENVRPWLLGFLGIVLVNSVVFLITQGFMLVIVYTTGRQMFQDVMTKVCHATFRFYDVTPVGRLMNRLTGDINTIDGNISSQFQGVAEQTISLVTSIVVIASITPVFLIFSFVLTAAFVYLFFKFLPTSQSLRRLEMVSLSPLMSDFGALLDGLLTVRAFGVQKRFQDRLVTVVDAFQKMDHFYWCGSPILRRLPAVRLLLILMLGRCKRGCNTALTSWRGRRHSPSPCSQSTPIYHLD